MNKIGFYTLGCKVNIYESNALKNEFINEGFVVTEEDDICDVYVINTCSVTNMADAKSRKMIQKAKKMNSDAIIVVMGCYSQTNKEALTIDGIDILIGNGNKSKTVNLVKESLEKKERQKHIEILDILNTTAYDPLEVSTFDHTRAFVKIEDGCSNFCTYCIIPYARGPVRSKKAIDVINELNRITNLGYEEIVLAGIHTGRYLDNDVTLSDLIEKILYEVPKLKRLRLSSIEINEIDDKLLSLMEKSNVIADHLHLPLQAGSDKILKLMNRRYNKEFFLNKIKDIRKIRPNISITTDVIVGFPYEEEEDFLETYEFIKKLELSKIHVFPYSKRSNTKAFDMPQVKDNLKKDRVKRLIELSDQLEFDYAKKFLNAELNVIIEKQYNDIYMIGHSSNFLTVLVPLNVDLIKKMVNVSIKKVEKNTIIASLG